MEVTHHLVSTGHTFTLVIFLKILCVFKGYKLGVGGRVGPHVKGQRGYYSMEPKVPSLKIGNGVRQRCADALSCGT